MNLQEIRDGIIGAIVGGQIGSEGLQDLTRELEARRIKEDDVIQEGLAELELAVDDMGWRAMDSTQLEAWALRRSALTKMSALSRLMYLMNPLIHRAVSVQALYVWGSGVSIKGESEEVTDILNDFFDDPKNQKVIGQAWPEREHEQRIDGNTFFTFFVNKKNGRARIRLMPLDVVQDIVTNPEDSKEVYFYQRSLPDGGQVLYPDINYNPRSRPSKFNDVGIDWGIRVLHVRTGSVSSMRYGMPELFSALAWAKAYKGFLENFSTIMTAYARIAVKMTGLPGKKGVAAAKANLNTAITTGQTRDTNPPRNVASTMLASGQVDLSPVKTANSTTGPDEARALRSMVAAGSDMPEHFFGDSDIGNFATSATLDRPTELKMIDRQNMWKFVILTIAKNLIEWSSLAPSGKLRMAGFKAKSVADEFDGSKVYEVTAPKDKSIKTLVVFPTILERDVVDRVRAVVQATTLGGAKAEGILPNRKYVAKLMLIALGEKDVDSIVDKMYPDDVIQGFADPAVQQNIDKQEADAKMKLGDAAVTSAAAKKKAADKPTPAASTGSK